MTQAQTSVQKILAHASGLQSTQVGEIVYPTPQWVILHDGYVEIAHKELSEMGYARVAHPERVMFVTDHEVAYSTQRALLRGQTIRKVAKDWQVGEFFDAGRAGHGHLHPMEMGLIKPGMFVFAYDMHATNFGAVGALAIPVSSEITSVLATGSVWVKVPSTIRVNLSGQWREGSHPRDLGFLLAQGLSKSTWGVAGDYLLIEFVGDALSSMPLSSKVALCNSITEIGVASVLFPQHLDASYDCLSDEGAEFEALLDFDLSLIEPQLALPGGPDLACPVSQALGTPVQHAFIGACGSGMYEDFVDAAALLKGHHVSADVRMFVVPGTVQTQKRLANDGILQQFMDAGAMVLPPGCGPCAGGMMAPLGSGETSISTAATNHTGRFGPKDSLAYLGSPLTVVASAIRGEITDPRSLEVVHA